LVFAQAACAAPSVTGSAIPSPAESQSAALASLAGQLPPGVYYASFWSNQNVVRYYALTTPTAAYVGRALISAGSCHVSANHTIISLDMQRQLDIAVTCGTHSGFLQLPVGRMGFIRPIRQIVTRFSDDSVIESSVDSNGNVAIG
jgi:hypothetical protein